MPSGRTAITSKFRLGSLATRIVSPLDATGIFVAELVVAIFSGMLPLRRSCANEEIFARSFREYSCAKFNSDNLVSWSFSNA